MNMSETSKRIRNGNIELLRVISMLMIVTLHYLLLGGILSFITPSDGVVYYLAWCVESVCYVSVNCFVLISGYFLCTAEFKVSRLLSFALETWFYSMAICIVACLTGLEKFSLMSVLTAYGCPLIKGVWWFSTVYAVLLCLAPWLNILMINLTARRHLMLLAVITFLFSILPTVFFFSNDIVGLKGGYSLIWFCVLYCYAGYLRLHPVKMSKGLCLAAFFGCALLTAFCKFAQVLLIGEKGEYINLYRYSSPTVLFGSVALFAFFISMKSGDGKLSPLWRYLGGCTYAVFLIHTHPVVADRLWNVLSPAKHVGEWGYGIVCVLGIFSACVLIDTARKFALRPLVRSGWMWNLFSSGDSRARKIFFPDEE